MRASPLTLLPIAALWLLSAGATAGPVYKWVDEKGVTHYSDQPHPQAKEVAVAPPQTYKSTPVATPQASASSEREATGPRYQTCEISRPEKDEVFLNTSTVTASVRIEPALRLGDRIVLTMDGKRLTDQPPSARSFVLNGMERGTHSLVMTLEDAQGKPVCTSAATTFHVRQPSKQAPVKAVRPRF
jgi:hypothetical protein